MRNKRIALFLPSLAGGGAERSLINLSAALAEKAFAVDMVVANAQGEYRSLLRDPVRLVDLEAGGTMASIPALVRYLKTQHPDVIMAALDHANIAAQIAVRIARTRTRTVISVRNTASAESACRSSRRRQVEVALARRLYPTADAVVTVSQGVADDLAVYLRVPRERITVTYNPVVSDDLLRRCLEPSGHPWLDSASIPVVLAAGRLGDQKDYVTLLRAFKIVIDSHEARLVILGEGERRRQLETFIIENGMTHCVQLPGFCENPFAFMSRAAVFVLSSRHEGLPGVLIQALASQCPVVSTNCPSGPDEILKGGLYGALVPVGDPPALAAAILHKLSGPRESPPPESWEPFTFDRSTERYLSALLPERSIK